MDHVGDHRMKRQTQAQQRSIGCDARDTLNKTLARKRTKQKPKRENMKKKKKKKQNNDDQQAGDIMAVVFAPNGHFHIRKGYGQWLDYCRCANICV